MIALGITEKRNHKKNHKREQGKASSNIFELKLAYFETKLLRSRSK